MKYLFIGGQADGKWITVSDNLKYIKVPVYEPIHFDIHTAGTANSMECTCEIYEKMPFRCGPDREFDVFLFVLERMSPFEMMTKLMTNYKKKGE